MDMNMSSRSLMQGNGSCGGFDLRCPTRIPHNQQHSLALQHQPNSHPGQGSAPIHDTLPLTIGTAQNCEKNKKSDKGKSPSDEDEPIFLEDVTDERDDTSHGKKASPWHRVKWTDAMVKLLITSVSYINEEAAAEDGACVRRKCPTIQKKGKWKSVSKVMAERGHVVSPQQCEDKFNDLNKRYKRLNEILGRGTSCEVVENPALLDVMDHIPEKTKEEVRKILSSKHLHYEEMCSYHNGNRLHLPPDPELQHSLRLALRNKDDHDENDVKQHPHNDHDGESDGCDESEEYEILRGDCRAHGISGSGAKRAKQAQSREDFSFNSLDCNKGFNFQADTDTNKIGAEGSKTNAVRKQMSDKQNLELEEQRLQIEAEMLELEKERFKWQRFCWKKDREFETRRMEIERMKLENERMGLELRQKEIAFETVNKPT